jgi:serine phosphatase RsbU (regulator of sigma subunit)
MTKTRSFRTSLVVNLAMGVVLLGVTLLSINLYARHLIVKRASAEILETDITQASRAFDTFTVDAAKMLTLAVRWAKNDWSGTWSPEELDDNFSYLMLAIPYAEASLFARYSGEGYAIRRFDNGWGSWLRQPGVWENEYLVRKWTDAEPEPKQGFQEVVVDLSQSPWFAQAITRREARGRDASLEELLYVSDPYPSVTTGEILLTGSVAFEDVDGEPAVVGVAITPKFITEKIREARIGNAGMMAALYGTADRKENVVILGAPEDPRYQTDAEIEQILMRPYSELGGPIATLMDAYFERGDDVLAGPIRFESDGQIWWGNLAKRAGTTLDQVTGQPRWIAVVVPEKEIQEALPKTTLIILGVTGVVLILAAFQATRLAGIYGAPIEQLVEEGRRMQRLDFTKPGKIDTKIQEIGVLSETLDGMRRALYSYTSVSEEARITDSIIGSTIPGTLPKPTGYQVEAFRKSTEEFGGESFDALELTSANMPESGPAGAFMYLVLDAQASGIEAAVMTAQLRTVFRTASRSFDNATNVAMQMDRHLSDDVPGLAASDTWVGHLNSGDNRIESVSVGIETILHWQAATQSFTNIGADGNASTVPEASSGLASPWRQNSVSLAPGDIVCVASNGVIDALNPQRDRFGMTRLKTVIADHATDDAADVIRQIEVALDSFCQGTRATAGKTVFVIKRT